MMLVAIQQKKKNLVQCIYGKMFIRRLRCKVIKSIVNINLLHVTHQILFAIIIFCIMIVIYLKIDKNVQLFPLQMWCIGEA